MNIVYHQHGQFEFLAEGFAKHGHRVYPVTFREQESFDAQVEAVCPDADLVFFELYGPFKLPSEMEHSRYRKVAYCIDSAVYEYFYIHLLKLFNDVFVDQKSAVAALQAYGIRAAWLPLCVPESHFRGAVDKEYDIVFVGGLSEDRQKRTHILNHIRATHRLVHLQGLAVEEMQDAFARGRMVLNENFFDGVNLRTFQALASGSLLLTEAQRDGLDDLFTPNVHFVGYTPDTLSQHIDAILQNPKRSEAIARRGQQLCHEQHSSSARAAQCLALLQAGTAYTPPRSASVQKLAAAQALFARSLRFGGDFAWAVALVKDLLDARERCTGEAYTLWGSMMLLVGKRDRAIEAYTQAMQHDAPFMALIKLCQLAILAEQATAAQSYIVQLLMLQSPPNTALLRLLPPPQSPALCPAALRFLLARLLYERGLVFHIGFFCRLPQYLPESALELAYDAWSESRQAEHLDFICRCFARKGIEQEALPLLEYAIQHGFATVRQQGRYAKLRASVYAGQ